MQTRLSMAKFTVCCVFVLLMSVPVTSARAGSRYRCRNYHPRVYGASGYYAGPGVSIYPGMGYYYDVRDTRTYAAQGYNVPVTVPTAPITRTYNYGWGIPSTRLSPIGSYSRWYPDAPFTQNGGRLPAKYPVVYQPTDTTETGIYPTYVPTWQPR